MTVKKSVNRVYLCGPMFSEKDLIFRAPEHTVLEFAGGGFARRILVIAGAGPEHPGSRDFLVKILAASRLNLERDTLFADVPTGQPLFIVPAIKQKHAEYILVFGLPPSLLGINAEMPLYQPRQFYGATFLFAESLAVLEPDKTRKGKLWQALQQIFP